MFTPDPKFSIPDPGQNFIGLNWWIRIYCNNTDPDLRSASYGPKDNFSHNAGNGIDTEKLDGRRERTRVLRTPNKNTDPIFISI